MIASHYKGNTGKTIAKLFKDKNMSKSPRHLKKGCKDEGKSPCCALKKDHGNSHYYGLKKDRGNNHSPSIKVGSRTRKAIGHNQPQEQT